MGMYINSENETKESWLKREATIAKPKYPPPKDELFVCLVHNNSFTAAGVAYDEREFNAFNDPSDHRLRIWFTVPWKKLKDVIPEHYFKQLEKQYGGQSNA